MRILVLRGGAIGDFIVTLPMLGLLRSRWPAADIEVVGNARAAELGLRGGCLNAVHSQDEGRWSALYAGEPLPVALADWLAAFELVISFWPDPDATLARRFPLHPGQRFLAAPATPALVPAARHFCEVLRPLGLSTTDFRSRLPIGTGRTPTDQPAPAAAPGTAVRSTRRRLAIHPGSGSARKNWPAARWRELIARAGEPILLVLGEAERAWSEGGQPLLGIDASGPTTVRREPVEVSRDLPLPELAATLAGCRLFVGHDSGLSHLAAAVGTPCVLLFGPTDPAMWAPPGDQVRVIRHGENLEAIGVDEVLAAVTA